MKEIYTNNSQCAKCFEILFKVWIGYNFDSLLLNNEEQISVKTNVIIVYMLIMFHNKNKVVYYQK